jgi:hypothetical protein
MQHIPTQHDVFNQHSRSLSLLGVHVHGQFLQCGHNPRAQLQADYGIRQLDL